MLDGSGLSLRSFWILDLFGRRSICLSFLTFVWKKRPALPRRFLEIPRVISLCVGVLAQVMINFAICFVFMFFRPLATGKTHVPYGNMFVFIFVLKCWGLALFSRSVPGQLWTSENPELFANNWNLKVVQFTKETYIILNICSTFNILIKKSQRNFEKNELLNSAADLWNFELEFCLHTIHLAFLCLGLRYKGF